MIREEENTDPDRVPAAVRRDAGPGGSRRRPGGVGNDLSASQKAEVYEFFGIDQGSVEN
jgi:hypothetical protein